MKLYSLIDISHLNMSNIFRWDPCIITRDINKKAKKAVFKKVREEFLDL